MRLLGDKAVLRTAIAVAALGAVAAVVFLVVLPPEFRPGADLAPEEPSIGTEEPAAVTHMEIGRSVEGRPIGAYFYGGAAGGSGSRQLVLFVGGIHGGYEWNSVVLAYQFMDHLENDPTAVPDGLAVAVIPSLNPDGVYKVVGREGRFAATDVPLAASLPAGTGRFNANGVDLNRNFDCRWQPQSTWRNQPVSAGTAPFSEPEAAALRDFVLKHKPAAVIFWHSQANAVYASECQNGILPETLAIMNAYSRASDYRAVESFDAYPVTGDAEGWLASIGIPAITVELSTHEAIEWEKNLAGARAVMGYYGER